jgi:hypothetical protein
MFLEAFLTLDRCKESRAKVALDPRLNRTTPWPSHVQVTSKCRGLTSRFVPHAAMAAQPRQHLQATFKLSVVCRSGRRATGIHCRAHHSTHVLSRHGHPLAYSSGAWAAIGGKIAFSPHWDIDRPGDAERVCICHHCPVQEVRCLTLCHSGHLHLLSQRAAVGACPLEHLEVASLGACPLEHVEMAFPSRIGAGPIVPGAAIGARPLEHVEVASHDRIEAGGLVPGTAVGARSRWRAPTGAQPGCPVLPSAY